MLDNLSSHSAAALYRTFEPEEARRILRRREFHPVPKHDSWLNMVEIEITGQCLDRRIESHEELTAEIGAWEQCAMLPVPASTSCSQPKGPASKWVGRIRDPGPA